MFYYLALCNYKVHASTCRVHCLFVSATLVMRQPPKTVVSIILNLTPLESIIIFSGALIRMI